ncbi:hypothetical protein F4818DRAFT_421361 [Hypoxylon cercidicola]|nr:hypothetical protein F4818DRAFT_421361 [Hypoxylon cercidicola]
MTEVVPADRTKLLQSKRAECSALIRSRKRKLCVLYAVASTPETLPQRSFADPDAKSINAGESQFLEGCDILLGRKLNESSIPTRPRPRSDYPQNPRPGGSYIPNRSAPPAVTKKQDGDSNKRPVIPSPSASRPGPSDGQTNAIFSPPVPQPGPVLKQPQQSPAWSNQSADASATKDISPLINEQHKPGFPSNEKAETLPGTNRPNGTSPIANGLPTGSSDLSQSHTNQISANEQRQLDPRHTDAQQRNLDHGTPMDIDVAPSKKSDDKPATVHLAPQADTGHSVDAVSPNPTALGATTPGIPNASTNPSPDRDGVPFAGSAEAKAVGMKDENALKQSLNSLAPPKPSVAGMSESVPSQSKHQPGSTESPGNAILEATTTVNSVQPPKSPLPAANGLLNEKPVPLEVDIHPLQQLSEDDSHGRPMASVQTDEQQTDSNATSLGAPVIEALGNSDENRTTTKEKVVASNASSQVAPQIHSQDVRQPPTPTNPLSDQNRPNSPTGVARQKPVSEILSEAPQPSRDHEPEHTALITPTSQSTKHQSQNLLHQVKLKEMSKRATVVFGKLPKPPSDADRTLVQNRSKAGQMLADDYFTPLFVQAFTTNSRWMKPLDQILHQAHKTLSTPDSYTQILENQACRLLKRVYHLQHHNKWSLRQPKRCPEPPRQASHWDVLLKEMKWMRTDFREERKWKMAAAQNLAYACAEWVSASPEDRKALQVNAIIPPLTLVDAGDVPMTDAHHPQSSEDDPTPELSPSAEFDSPLEPDDEPHHTMIDTVAPSAIFTLESNDVVFALHQSAAADSLLNELPLYGSPLEVPKSDLTAPEYDPDASWRRPALPLSKYVEGRMKLTSNEPPKKRSRYRYAQEDEEDDEVIFGEHSDSQPRLEPRNPDVALFWPENKTIRDRLHAGHQFRPPNEHNMPFQSFYEFRSPSQWVQSEDDELKSLVREYSYNWSLISSILSSKSMFSSSAERRTPWECFERWVMLEGLPHDMQKTTYFKLWQGRIDASQQVIRNHQDAMQQQAQQQQQSGANGPVTPIPKRRFNVPLNVPRRRNQRHLTMIDAMRKLAKKRETAIQKQQHAASLAAMRKTNEAPQAPRGPTKTPREYSIMRFERDQAMAERLAERMAQQQRHEAQRRAALQQRAQQGQVAQMAAAAQNTSQLSQSNPPMAASHPHAAMARVTTPNPMSINGQGRPRMPMHATPNGASTPNHMGGGLVPPMQMNGASQVQMPAVNGQSRMAMPTAQPDIQLLMQAAQISEQQRRSVQMRQQQQQQQQQQQPLPPQTHHSPQGSMPLQSSPPAMRAAAMSGLNQKSYLNNAQAQAMIASFNNANGSGMSTPPAQGLTVTPQAGSPRPNSTMPTSTHQTYVSQLQHIESQIRQAHPNTPQDMVRDMARQLLNTRHNNHNLAQSAMNAAAGGTGHAAAANGPHQYAQLLRAQQQQQAAAAAAAQAQQAQQGAQHQRNSSGSATPTPSVPK